MRTRSILFAVGLAVAVALPGCTTGGGFPASNYAGVSDAAYRVPPIPVYKLDGRMVLFFAGFAHHYSIYPASVRLVRSLGRDLGGRLRNKTIRFALDAKVPTRLIARIARLRAAEVMESAKAR